MNWVLDADIRGHFSTIDHGWMLKFLEHRIADRRVIGLINQWLAAGVVEDGEWSATEAGTPQGSVISPELSNVYLHYVLDLWTAQWRRRQAKGDVVIVRYADDFVMGFQFEGEARRFLAEMRERFARYGLELHPEKTRLIEFGRFAAERRREVPAQQFGVLGSHLGGDGPMVPGSRLWRFSRACARAARSRPCYHRRSRIAPPASPAARKLRGPRRRGLASPTMVGSSHLRKTQSDRWCSRRLWRRRAGRTWLLAVLLGIASCERTGPPPGAGPDAELVVVPVRVARAEAGQLPRTVRAMGSFYADDQATVGAEAAGRIVFVGPEAGDRADQGTILCRVDDTDYLLARDQKALALAESLARLGLEALPEDGVDFEHLPALQRARLEAANAQAKCERALKLHDRDPPLVSDQDFADLKTAWDVAESVHAAAVLAAQTDLAQARTRNAELAAAEQRVRETIVQAPQTSAVWLVAERRVAVGDYVAVGAPLYRLVDADPLRLRVRVPERRMGGVVSGCEVAVSTAASPTPLGGRVTRLRPEVDPRTRTYDVEIEVPNAELRHTVGAFAIAEIAVGTDDAVPLVAQTAVVAFAGVRKLLVPVDGKAAERIVVLGRRQGDRVEIAEGIRIGDAYIAQPPPGLVAGSPILVEEVAAAGGAR